MSLKLSLALLSLWLSESEGEKNAARPMLFSSPSWDISCSMGLLTGGVNSPPVGFHSYLWGQWNRASRPPPPPWMSSTASYLVSPFFPSRFSMPQNTPAGNMLLMSVPLPLSPEPPSPSQTQPSSLSCSLPLCRFPHHCKCTFHQHPLWRT